MKLDDALREAFDRDARAVPERRPTSSELSRACGGYEPGHRRALRLRPADIVPILALAAAAVVVPSLDPAFLMVLRPLASGLAVSIPHDTGSRIVDFILMAGESYRSFD